VFLTSSGDERAAHRSCVPCGNSPQIRHVPDNLHIPLSPQGGGVMPPSPAVLRQEIFGTAEKATNGCRFTLPGASTRWPTRSSAAGPVALSRARGFLLRAHRAAAQGRRGPRPLAASSRSMRASSDDYCRRGCGPPIAPCVLRRKGVGRLHSRSRRPVRGGDRRRFRKGLTLRATRRPGYMNPGQLWETTLTSTRARLLLLQVTYQGGRRWPTTSSPKLMGDVVEPRRLRIHP